MVHPEKPRSPVGKRRLHILKITLAACCWAVLSAVFFHGAAKAQLYVYNGPYKGTGGVTFDPAVSTDIAPIGALFGTAQNREGKGPKGAVYMLTPPATPGAIWAYTQLVSFPRDYLAGPLTADSAGNLYGMSQGRSNPASATTPSRCALDCGSIFVVSPPTTAGGKWTARWLHHFHFSQGAWPHLNRLTVGPSGVIYGTAPYGGDAMCNDGNGCGTAFTLSPPAVSGIPAWTFRIIHMFHQDSHGSNPFGGLVFDHSGALYGTALNGGPNSCGVLFQLVPLVGGARWADKILHSFGSSATDLCGPGGDLAVGDQNELYGAVNRAGTEGAGGVFSARPPAVTI